MELNESNHWVFILTFSSMLITFAGVIALVIWNGEKTKNSILYYSYFHWSSNPYKINIVWGDKTSHWYYSKDGINWTYEDLLNHRIEDVKESNPERVKALCKLLEDELNENSGV